MANAVQRLQWDYVVEITVILTNVLRDTKEHPKPYTKADLHPLRTAADYAKDNGEDGSPDWAMIQKIKSQYKVTKLNARRQSDQSG